MVTIDLMTIQRMDHVGIVVDDLALRRSSSSTSDSSRRALGWSTAVGWIAWRGSTP